MIGENDNEIKNLRLGEFMEPEEEKGEVKKNEKKFDIQKFKRMRSDAEIKINNLDALIKKYEEIQQIIVDIGYLKKYGGKLLFSGKSGKIGEDNILREIHINSVDGCLMVPALILKLADEKLFTIKNELIADDYLKNNPGLTMQEFDSWKDKQNIYSDIN